MNEAGAPLKHEATAGGAENDKERKLSLRDWFLLPLIGLLTIFIIAVSVESIALRMFSGSATSLKSCLSFNDPSTGVRGIPNAVCHDKMFEGQPEEYRLNGCGHRAGVECGPKSPGVYRVVMIGPSFVFGDGVAREETIAARLPGELSRLTGRKVEVYNEGMMFMHPHVIALRFNEALAAQPDLIVWPIMPYDVEVAPVVLPPPSPPRKPGSDGNSALRESEAFLGSAVDRVKNAFDTESFPNAVRVVWDRGLVRFGGTRTALLLQHFLYKSQSQYVKSYLMGQDIHMGFLKVDQSAEWQTRISYFDTYVADIESRARAAGVPLVVVLVPQRAQAAMISMGNWPAGYDPYKLDDELRTIVVSHGGDYIDIFPDIRNIPNPEQYYFPVDGHPDGAGHAMISRLIARELTSDAIPALRVGAQTLVASKQR